MIRNYKIDKSSYPMFPGWEFAFTWLIYICVCVCLCFFNYPHINSLLRCSPIVSLWNRVGSYTWYSRTTQRSLLQKWYIVTGGFWTEPIIFRGPAGFERRKMTDTKRQLTEGSNVIAVQLPVTASHSQGQNQAVKHGNKPASPSQPFSSSSSFSSHSCTSTTTPHSGHRLVSSSIVYP